MTASGMRRAALASAAVAALTAAGIALPALTAEPQRTAALPPGAQPRRPQVIDLRFGRHADSTRIVIELSEQTPFKVEALSDPPQIVVGFGGLAPAAGPFAEGPGVDLIDRYRQEGDGAGRRLVFHGAGPVRVKEAFMIPPREGHQSRLVIDIARGAPPQSISAAAARPPGPPPGPLSASPGQSSSQIRPAGLTAPPGPPGQKPGAAKPAQAPLVVIDAGHGGADPGAVGVGGVYEKDITLAAARELRRQLQASGRYRIKMTRDSDVFIRLRDRVAIAREAEADLFISLHADAMASDQMRGLSIYTLSGKASDREAEMLAAKENRADAIVGMDLSSENPLVASILIDLAQRDTMNHSKRFAGYALTHLSKDVRILSSKPQREAGFAVLTAPDVPSALVEMGYLSNPTDAKLLTSAEHREKMTRDMVNAVDAYFGWLGKAKR
jgi:N-acetylmuramoyl-L-alanine amidase